MGTAKQEDTKSLLKHTASLADHANEQNFENQLQYLTFLMQDEEYGVDILNVQEIRGWGNVSPIPNAPAFVSGVINLRGAIVPVIDLRILFELSDSNYDENTVVIVLKVTTERVNRIMGIVVDSVSDVFTLSPTDKQPPPSVNQSVSREFIEGLTEVKGKMVILLDSERLLYLENNL
ncbi:MAG: purine-binding chemotaxis protein CheW [Oceanospirillaceae bacterium]|jgi:purine-binding chemotaxis protein CheW|tara:strand:+ start:16717 stop:17247 length:531 start_codon:yes stop_codon:yes gene_type:complete